MKYQPPKGTQDLFNEKFYTYDKVAQSILKVTELYGFRQLRTPGFEPIEILAKDAGSEITNQIYTFKDKAERELGIKSDITPAVARFVVGNGKSMLKPIKISCYDRVYRYERPQSGRNREITQINAELFCAPTGIVEAELLACFYQCYAEINLPQIVIEINSRPLLEGFIKQLGVPENQVMSLVRLIDKKDKIGRSKFNEEITAFNIPNNSVKKIQQFININGEIKPILKFIQSLIKKSNPLNKYIEELIQLTKYSKMYGIDKRIRINLGFARGFEYYTGLIFEARIKGTDFGSLGGGGRYDNLVSQYGGVNTTAIGFSIGIDRIVLALQKLNKLKLNNSPEIDYYLVSKQNNFSVSKMIKYAQKLRKQGKKVEIDLLGKNETKQTETAKKLQVKQIINLNHHNLAL